MTEGQVLNEQQACECERLVKQWLSTVSRTFLHAYYDAKAAVVFDIPDTFFLLMPAAFKRSVSFARTLYTEHLSVNKQCLSAVVLCGERRRRFSLACGSRGENSRRCPERRTSPSFCLGSIVWHVCFIRMLSMRGKLSRWKSPVPLHC